MKDECDRQLRGPHLSPPASVVALLASAGFSGAAAALGSAGLRVAFTDNFDEIVAHGINSFERKRNAAPSWSTLFFRSGLLHVIGIGLQRH